MKHVLVFMSALVLGCGQTGQDIVSFPVHAAGTGEAQIARDGWVITVQRADLGFGPLYLCATPFADLDVCPRAEAELLTTHTIDALDESPQMLGEADAITGTVRSAMFDYGIAWLLVDRRPRAREGAPGGHSAIFVAQAERGEDTLRIDARVEVLPRVPGGSAVIGAPTGEHTITGDEALTVRFDPAALFGEVDIEALWLADDGDGQVTLEPGDPAYEALVIAMTTAPPTFEWTE